MRPTPAAIRVTLIALVLVAAGRLLPGERTQATEIQPLDLAAMVLFPEDLEIHGLSGYGSDYGQYLTASDYAAGFARQEGMDFDDALDIFESMGLLRGYTVRLALPSEEGDFYSDATEGMHIRILEYDSVASAASMFDLSQAEIEESDREVVESPKEFGDDWIFSRSDADDRESGDPARELSLEFRVGHLTAMIAMFDVAGKGEPSQPEEPDIDIVEQLGEQLLERIEDADSSEQPLLGNQALRLTDEGGSIVTVGDRYYAMNGTPLRRFAESDDAFESRADSMESDGTIATYGLEQDVRSGDFENAVDPHMTVRLYQFEDTEAAEEWVKETGFERFADEGYAQNLDVIDLPFDLGDATFGANYEAEFGGEELTGTAIWVQVNDVAARVTFEGADEIEIDVFEELVGAQVDCMRGNPCAPIQVPRELL